MFRVSFKWRMIVHSPRGIPFGVGADEVNTLLRRKFGGRWLGVSLDLLQLSAPSAEFLPFYFCEGRIQGTFRGIVSYSNGAVGLNEGKGDSRWHQVETSPQPLRSRFGQHQTQIYAGYKYNIYYVQSALRSEANPMKLQKMPMVDVKGATINLFEQSTNTLKEFVNEEVRRQATETARAMVREYHPTASSIDIKFQDLSIHIEEVTPVFMPCYVVKAAYDAHEYTLYVDGQCGNVSGPLLLNSLYVGRLAAAATAILTIFLSPNKGVGFVLGSLLSIPMYHIAFYSAKYFPKLRRDYFRLQRRRLQARHEDRNASGFRPCVDSKRIHEEYCRSSYWDTHEFQRGAHRHAGGPVKDQCGYYSSLGLKGTESVNEIRSAYRRLVLSEHPDAGGTTARMAKINEAYRVLRDPQRRAQYDAAR
ncbi:putative DNAJ domain protein [Trypanosoma vivax]|nr:putative DNAJ domain protein [Trypanosoma vivax]